MRPVLSAAFFLMACVGVDKPNVPTTENPLPTPAPTPVPAPAPVPQPSYTPPPASTPLVDVPSSEWPDLCDALAMAVEADMLFCGDFEFEIPAASKAEMVGLCVADFGGSASVPGCIATVGDLTAYYAADIDCDYIFDPPPVVEVVGTCFDDTTPPTPPICEFVASSSPADGSSGVFPGTSLIWTLSDADPTFSLVLFQGNTLVPGSGSFSGNVFTWTPDLPLEPNTTYEASGTWCNGAQSAVATFTTGTIGTPVDTSQLTANAYQIDLTDPAVVWVQPPGVGPLFASQIDVPILLGISSATATNLNVRVTLGVAGTNPAVQDECVETTPSSGDFTDNPYFEDISLVFDLGGVPFGPLPVSGAFSPDGSSAVVAMQGAIDTRPLVPLLTPGGADEAVCDLVAQFGINCVSCPGGGDFCLQMHIENIPVTELPNTTVVEITASDVIFNPSCAP